MSKKFILQPAIGYEALHRSPASVKHVELSYVTQNVPLSVEHESPSKAVHTGKSLCPHT